MHNPSSGRLASWPRPGDLLLSVCGPALSGCLFAHGRCSPITSQMPGFPHLSDGWEPVSAPAGGVLPLLRRKKNGGTRGAALPLPLPQRMATVYGSVPAPLARRPLLPRLPTPIQPLSALTGLSRRLDLGVRACCELFSRSREAVLGAEGEEGGGDQHPGASHRLPRYVQG